MSEEVDSTIARFYSVGLAMILAPLTVLVTSPAMTFFNDVLSWAEGRVVFWPSLFALLISSAGGAVFTYPFMLLIGMPAYFVLKQFKMASVWTAAIVGFVTPALGLTLLSRNWAFAIDNWEPLIEFGVMGLVVGVVFIRIAKHYG